MKDQIYSTIAFILLGAFLIVGFLYVDQVQQNDPIKEANKRLMVVVKTLDSVNTINAFRIDSVNESNERYAEVFMNLKNKKR